MSESRGDGRVFHDDAVIAATGLSGSDVRKIIQWGGAAPAKYVTRAHHRMWGEVSVRWLAGVAVIRNAGSPLALAHAIAACVSAAPGPVQADIVEIVDGTYVFATRACRARLVGVIAGFAPIVQTSLPVICDGLSGTGRITTPHGYGSYPRYLSAEAIVDLPEQAAARFRSEPVSHLTVSIWLAGQRAIDQITAGAA